MLIDEVTFLCAPTFRSRAYAQTMRAHKLLPARALYLEGKEPSWDGSEEIQTNFSQFAFKPNETALLTLQNAGVKVTNLTTQNVNSDIVISELSKTSSPVILYSGPPGALLHSPMLALGKKILHVHGGITPEYRGSVEAWTERGPLWDPLVH